MEPWAIVPRFMVAEHADLPVADRVGVGLNLLDDLLYDALQAHDVLRHRHRRRV